LDSPVFTEEKEPVALQFGQPVYDTPLFANAHID
jgi:hypothetical protein